VPHASTIIALLAAIGVGSIIGIVLRAEHEHAERRRDREIDVAEELTIALQTATAALWRATIAVRWHDPTKTPEERRATAKAATAALAEVRKLAAAADAIVPRYSLIFPAEKIEADILRPYRVTNAIRGAVGAAEGMLASPLPRSDTLNEMLQSQMMRSVHEFGGFVAHTNLLIWERWYTPLVGWARRLRRSREAELEAALAGELEAHAKAEEQLLAEEREG
jgi:hypothetical protein